jgi:hypothetical protein
MLITYASKYINNSHCMFPLKHVAILFVLSGIQNVIVYRRMRISESLTKQEHAVRINNQRTHYCWCLSMKMHLISYLNALFMWKVWVLLKPVLGALQSPTQWSPSYRISGVTGARSLRAWKYHFYAWTISVIKSNLH